MKKSRTQRGKYLNSIFGPFNWFALGVSGKTSWEWMQLLIIPSFLAFGAFYLESRVEKRQERVAENRYKQDRQLADDRGNQETLFNYFDQMKGLLLQQEIHQSSENFEVESLAKGLTAATIKDLDTERNSLLVVFLQQADFLDGTNFGEDRLTLLYDTDLSGANLGKAELSDAMMSHTNLSNADLENAYLRGVRLFSANLSEANLSNADLSRADLSRADLSRADLSNADLSRADLSNADLSRADLSNAISLTNGQLKQAVLCSTQLPKSIDLDPDRDCEDVNS